MNRLKAQAELLKIGHLLDETDGELDFLERYDDGALADLREAVNVSVFDDHRHMFTRMAKATRVMPANITAQVAEKFFAPAFAAGVAAEMQPGKVAVLARKVATSYMASVAVEIDPVAAEPVIQRLDEEIVVEVARELDARREFFALANLAEVITDEMLHAVLDILTDDEHLLRIGLLLQDGTLSRAVSMLSEEQLHGMIRCARETPELWPETMAIASALPERQRTFFAQIVAEELSGGGVEDLVKAIYAYDLWGQLMRVGAVAPKDFRERLFGRVMEAGDATTQMMDAVRRDDALHEFFDVVSHLTGGVRDVLVGRVRSLPGTVRSPVAQLGRKLGYNKEADDLSGEDNS